MSDIADILGLGAETSSGSLQNKDAANLLQSFNKPKVSVGNKQKKTKAKISREVLDLIGKDGVSSSPTSIGIVSGTIPVEADLVSPPIFKKRRTTATTSSAVNKGWIWTPLANPLRCTFEFNYPFDIKFPKVI